MLFFLNVSRRLWQSVCVRVTLSLNSSRFSRRIVEEKFVLAGGLKFKYSLYIWTPRYIPILGTAPFKWVFPCNVLFIWVSGQGLPMNRQPDLHWETPWRSSCGGGRKWIYSKDRKLIGLLCSIPFSSFVHLMAVWWTLWVCQKVVGARDSRVSRDHLFPHVTYWLV